MHPEPEDSDPDNDAPEIARQQTDIKECGRGKAEHERGQGIEEREAEGIASQVPADGPVPGCRAERGAVEDAGLGAVDQHTPEAQLADDFVQRSLGHQELLRDIAHTVKRRPKQRKEVSLELIPAAHAPAIGAGDVITGEQDSHAADADEDAEDLGGVVADAEEEEGDGDDEDDGPEVDELGGEDGGVAVGEDGEVVAFDVEEGEDDVCACG